MSEAQCWICPECYDDSHHIPGDRYCQLAQRNNELYNRVEALEAAPVPGVPKGWRLVPNEPTEKMLNWFSGTAYARLSPGKQSAERDHYRNMLAAAPEPEQPATSARPIKYTLDLTLAECPCCGSLDVGGVGGEASIEEVPAIVNCYSCGLQLRKRGTLKEACDAWNTRTGKVPADQSLREIRADAVEQAARSVPSDPSDPDWAHCLRKFQEVLGRRAQRIRRGEI